MFCDVFDSKQARDLLKSKKIWFIGSSNMRSIYKDVLWLLTNETIAPDYVFKTKNEESYLNDKRVSNDTLHNGVNYIETREYKTKNIYLFFHFITRLYLDHFIKLIESITPQTAPDVLIINSCLWDLSRWGPDGPKQFRENIILTMKLLKSKLPAKTKVIWKTTLPVSTSANSAFFIDEVKCIIPMLPWHILEANTYASFCANFFNYDTLDVHHYMRLQGHLRVRDGIHWNPNALRYLTNVVLTHLCLSWGKSLPGNFLPTEKYLSQTTKEIVATEKINQRINKKQGFFRKLMTKLKNSEKKKNIQLSGLKNKILATSKNIIKRVNKKNKKRNHQRGNNLNKCIKQNSTVNNSNSKQLSNYYTNPVNTTSATNFTFNNFQYLSHIFPQSLFINTNNLNLQNLNMFSFPAYNNYYCQNNYYSQYNYNQRW